MKIEAVVLSLFVSIVSASANDSIATPRLTAESLIRYYSGQPGTPLSEQSPDSIVKMQFADGYLAGVADSTQGKSWCDKGKVKTTEINSMVVAALRKYPQDRLRENAAILASEVLKKKFPCE